MGHQLHFVLLFITNTIFKLILNNLVMVISWWYNVCYCPYLALKKRKKKKKVDEDDKRNSIMGISTIHCVDNLLSSIHLMTCWYHYNEQVYPHWFNVVYMYMYRIYEWLKLPQSCSLGQILSLNWAISALGELLCGIHVPFQ